MKPLSAPLSVERETDLPYVQVMKVGGVLVMGTKGLEGNGHGREMDVGEEMHSKTNPDLYNKVLVLHSTMDND